MAKMAVAQIPAKLYELLEHLTPEDRSRVIPGDSSPLWRRDSGGEVG